MVMSASSAAFFAENFAGTISVAGALGTAKAPLTNTAFAGGAALGACELGSSLPIWPDGVCCALSCRDCCCASAGGGCCWAAARPALAANASASALVRKRAYCMAISFSSAARGRYPALPMGLGCGGRSADITAGADIWFRAVRASLPFIPAHSASLRAFTPVFDGLWTRVNALMLGIQSRMLRLWVPAFAGTSGCCAIAPSAALIGDLSHHNAGRGIDQQQAVVDDRVSVRPHGRHRGDDRLRHRRQRVSIADPGADGGIGGRGGWIHAAFAQHRRRRNRLGHDPLPHDRPASASLRYDRAIDRGALGGRERKRRRGHRRLIGARLIGARLVGWRLVGPGLVVGARLVGRRLVSPGLVVGARLVGWRLVSPGLVVGARLVTRFIDPCPRHIRLIEPGLRARRHRRGNERKRQACGADIRRHGDLLCRLGETLVNAAPAGNVPPSTDRQSFLPRERCYPDTTAGGYSRRRCSQDAFLAGPLFRRSVKIPTPERKIR